MLTLHCPLLLLLLMLLMLLCCCWCNQLRYKTLHGSPWRQSPVRRPVNPDAEVHQILSAGGASGGGVAAKRRPVVRYGQDLLSPGNAVQLSTAVCDCKLCSVYYPAPGRGTGYCFRAISFFLSFFVSNITRKWLLRFFGKYPAMDIRPWVVLCLGYSAGLICMKFSGKVWSDHGTTWLNFGTIRVNGSAGQRSIC